MSLARAWMRPLTMLLAASFIAAGPSPPPPSANDREATVVEALVVAARVRGPAWWRVSNGSSTVYVLGVPGGLPKGLGWDTTELERRLTGANVLIGTPAVSVGLGDVIPLWGASRKLRSKSPMEDLLPPDVRARFDLARAAISHDPNAYEGWTPAIAGLQLVGDYRKQAKLDGAEPVRTITRLAGKYGVKVKPSGVYRFLPLVKAAEGQIADAGPACMDDALHEIEAGPAAFRAAGEGWARGDVRASLRAERGYEKCLSRFPEGDELVTRTMTDATNAIAGALSKPGHSVAIVNLRTLLAQGGVLQELQARGYKVSTPDE